jgi:hypothetical protein
MKWIEGFRDYFAAVGFSQIDGHTRVAAFGNNPDIDSGPEDVWSGGGLYPWMSADTALEVLSSSANDTAAGTGARTVLIVGLNSSHAPISQTITLNGTTPVAIPTSLFRINSALIMSAGSGEVNNGDITIRVAGAGATRAVIQAGYGIARQSQYTVPAGYTLSVISLLFCINRPSSARDATVATFVRNPQGFYRMPLELSVDGNPYRHDGNPGIILPEKTDFGLRCNYVSAANTDMTGAWLGILKQSGVD